MKFFSKSLYWLFFCVLLQLVVSCGGSSSSAQNPSSILSFNPNSASILVGSAPIQTALTLSATESMSMRVTLASSNTAVASISPASCNLSVNIKNANPSCNVTITGIASGTTKITATGSNGNVAVMVVTVTPTPPSSNILSFNPNTANIIAGSPSTQSDLILTTTKVTSMIVTLKSLNTAVATVSPSSCPLSNASPKCNVTITGIASGITNIIATEPNGHVAIMTVTVTSSPPLSNVLSFNPNSVSVIANSQPPTQSLLSLTAAKATSMIVTLKSLDTMIATVSPSSCNLSVQVPNANPTCDVYITGIASGITHITATEPNGKVVILTVRVSGSPANDSGITMSVNGLSQTIYTAQTYNATFKFRNNTSSTINLGQMAISGASGLGVSIDPKPCSNISLSPGGECSVAANGASVATANTLVPLVFTLNPSGGSSQYQFKMDVVAVTQHPGYAAYRITNLNNPGHTLYVVTLNKNNAGTQQLVKYDSSGIGSLDPSGTYAQDTITVPNTPVGVTLYQNNFSGQTGGIGGVMYVSLDKSLTITNGTVSPAPWVPTDPSYGTIFSQYEPNVWSDAVSGDLRAILDITDINFVGLTQSFYGLDINSGNNLASGFIQSPYSSLTTSDMYNRIQSTLVQNYASSWGVSSTFMLAATNPNQWIMLIGLVNDLGADPIVYPTGFNQNLYTQYVKDLWTYYNKHTMYIDAGEISAGCILQANVTSPTTMLVQPKAGSNCPVTATSGPNSWNWNTFTAADFVGGAANASTSTLYGVNKTYRSMGKYISAAQSVGFLPYCTQPDIIYGPNTLGQPAYTSQYWTEQYGCLANASSYGDSVINQYDKVFHQYIPLNYAWAYDDALGVSSAITTDPTKFGFTMEVHQFY